MIPYFEMIHLVAVLSTTFLMMAVDTVWYSSMVWGQKLSEEVRKDTYTKRYGILAQHIVPFAGYFVMLSLLAWGVAVLPILSLDVLLFSIAVAVFVTTLTGVAHFTEGKPLRHFLVNGGFYCLFIVVGTLILNYWPW